MKDKTPLIRLAKREDMAKSKVWLIRLAAFAVAILIGMIIFAIAGALMALDLVIVKIFNIRPVTLGWPTLISVLMLGFGLTNISLGIIAEYLWRAFDAARARPPFIINTVEELNQTEGSSGRKS